MLDAIFAFFAMDGHGVYIWSAWAAGLLIVLGITLRSMWQLRASQRRLTKLTETTATGRDKHVT